MNFCGVSKTLRNRANFWLRQFCHGPKNKALWAIMTETQKGQHRNQMVFVRGPIFCCHNDRPKFSLYECVFKNRCKYISRAKPHILYSVESITYSSTYTVVQFYAVRLPCLSNAWSVFRCSGPTVSCTNWFLVWVTREH